MEVGSENIEKLREAYKLWNDTRGGSVQTWLDLMSDDITMRSVADHTTELTFLRATQGKSGALQYFNQLVSEWELLHFTPYEFIEQNNRVVVLSTCAFRFRKTAKIAETLKADVILFRNGLIVDFCEYFDTAQATTATQSN